MASVCFVMSVASRILWFALLATQYQLDNNFWPDVLQLLNFLPRLLSSANYWLIWSITPYVGFWLYNIILHPRTAILASMSFLILDFILYWLLLTPKVAPNLELGNLFVPALVWFVGLTSAISAALINKIRRHTWNDYWTSFFVFVVSLVISAIGAVLLFSNFFLIALSAEIMILIFLSDKSKTRSLSLNNLG